jgi:hypothetical protein
MEKENTKGKNLIKLVCLLVVIFALVFSFFYFTKKEKNVPILVPGNDQTKESMMQLKSFAEKFKEENGFYNNSEKEVKLDFCLLNKNNFIGTGVGNIICGNIVNSSPGKLIIHINSNKEDVSMYCFQKEINKTTSLCMDSSGYFGESSGCDGVDYKCQ